MDLFYPKQIKGHVVKVNTTHKNHIQGRLKKDDSNDNSAKGFSDAMSKALNGVNSLQQKSFQLNQQMLYDPESVDSHDLTIAMSKANMAVSMTKSIVDGALKAYKEIISIR